MFSRYIIASLLTIVALKLAAQQEQSLHFLQNVWQSNLTNPAFMSQKKIQIILPSIYYNINSPDVTVNDLFNSNAEGKLTLSDLANRAKFQNRMDANLNIQSLGLSFTLNKKLSLSAYHAVNGNPNIDVRGDLVKLIANGNNQFLGKTVSFGSAVNGSIYSEIGVGAAYKILENLSVGGRIKFLNGVASVFTEKNKLDVTFDQNDFNLRFDNDFDVSAYSFSTYKNIKSASDMLSKSMSGANKGLSFDLGASIKVGKIQLSVSTIDLSGSIKWKNNGKRYASSGIYTYSGTNTDDFFNVDSLNSDGFRDTLKNIIGFKESDNPLHTQKLPNRTYISGSYQLNEKLKLGVLFYNEIGGLNKSRTALIANATYHLLNNIQVGGSVGIRNNTFNNIGLHIVAHWGMVQLFGVTDNIITVFRPYNSRNANGRLGLNIEF